MLRNRLFKIYLYNGPLFVFFRTNPIDILLKYSSSGSGVYFIKLLTCRTLKFYKKHYRLKHRLILTCIHKVFSSQFLKKIDCSSYGFELTSQ